MVKTFVHIEGMRDKAAEALLNEAFRNAFPAKKVVSSYKKGCVEILSDEKLDVDALRDTANAKGYIVNLILWEDYEPKGFFLFRK